MRLDEMRREYGGPHLDIHDLLADPVDQFHAWFTAWRNSGPGEPNAMVLATVDAGGLPWARTVLLKQADHDGFVFYTNRASHKGDQLAANAQAALHFLWLPMARQVLVQGRVVHTSSAEDDTYFAVRPRESQLGAWASEQSRPLADRDQLVERFIAVRQQYEGETVPRPPHWGGYRLQPQRIEFWQGGAHRLHDRFAYERRGDGWHLTRLNP